jgi:hypothetical protein
VGRAEGKKELLISDSQSETLAKKYPRSGTVHFYGGTGEAPFPLFVIHQDGKVYQRTGTDVEIGDINRDGFENVVTKFAVDYRKRRTEYNEKQQPLYKRAINFVKKIPKKLYAYLSD